MNKLSSEQTLTVKLIRQHKVLMSIKLHFAHKYWVLLSWKLENWFLKATNNIVQ